MKESQIKIRHGSSNKKLRLNLTKARNNGMLQLKHIMKQVKWDAWVMCILRKVKHGDTYNRSIAPGCSRWEDTGEAH